MFKKYKFNLILFKVDLKIKYTLNFKYRLQFLNIAFLFMIQNISHIILKIAGWKMTGHLPKDIKTAVFIAAPHTSNWDFLIGRAGLYQLGIKKII